MKRHGVEERIDHRSYERQGIEQIPTIHMGVAATQMEQRSVVTDRGNINREIKTTNNLLRQLWEKIKQLKDWLKQALAPSTPLTLYEILRGVLESGEQRDSYGKIRDLKMAERVFTFMGENGISTMPELHNKYSEALTRYDSARQKVKFYEQRKDTLEENIRQGGIYFEHRELYNEYQKLKPRKQPKFYEERRAELMPFEYAQRYFKERHIGSDFSLIAWKNEQEKLVVEKGKVYLEYNTTRAQFSDVESVRLGAEKIVRELNEWSKRKQRSRETER